MVLIIMQMMFDINLQNITIMIFWELFVKKQ
jgi:hypothetical protein